MKIIDRFNESQLNLLKEINIIIEDREYSEDEIYNLSDIAIDKEIELINAEKKGEYNSIADLYGNIGNTLIELGNYLYEKKIVKIFNEELNKYEYKKILGYYKYLGGESTSDLIVGKIYIRVEPESDFRIVDESGEDYIYVSSNFNKILDETSDGWINNNELKTIGTKGSENGIIIIDKEFREESRITVEEKEKCYAITCGVYGYFVHTAYTDNYLEMYNNMKKDIEKYLYDLVRNIDDKDFCEKFCNKY